MVQGEEKIDKKTFDWFSAFSVIDRLRDKDLALPKSFRLVPVARHDVTGMKEQADGHIFEVSTPEQNVKVTLSLYRCGKSQPALLFSFFV